MSHFEVPEIRGMLPHAIRALVRECLASNHQGEAWTHCQKLFEHFQRIDRVQWNKWSDGSEEYKLAVVQTSKVCARMRAKSH